MKYVRPEIMNADQDSQFTSSAFIGLLQANNIQVSMDGKGYWRDNVFAERLWKSVKDACASLVTQRQHKLHPENEKCAKYLAPVPDSKNQPNFPVKDASASYSGAR